MVDTAVAVDILGESVSVDHVPGVGGGLTDRREDFSKK